MQTVGWPRVMLLPEASPLWLAACRAKDELAREVCAEHGAAAAQLWEQTSGVSAERTAFTLTLPMALWTDLARYHTQLSLSSVACYPGWAFG